MIQQWIVWNNDPNNVWNNDPNNDSRTIILYCDFGALRGEIIQFAKWFTNQFWSSDLNQIIRDMRSDVPILIMIREPSDCDFRAQIANN